MCVCVQHSVNFADKSETSAVEYIRVYGWIQVEFQLISSIFSHIFFHFPVTSFHPLLGLCFSDLAFAFR